MVDTIKIWLQDPIIIRRDCPLLISKPVNASSAKPPLRTKTCFPTSEGEDLIFERASYYDSIVRVDAHHQKIWFSFSLANFASSDRFALNPAPKEIAERALEKAQCYIESSLGIIANLKNANISRLDLYRDVITDHPFSRYLPLLRSMRFSRQKSNRYGTTTGAGNQQRETCIYDKTQQLLDKKLATNPPKNLLRWEYRLRKSKSVKHALGHKKVSELFQTWDKLAVIFNEYIENAFSSAYIPSHPSELANFNASKTSSIGEYVPGLSEYIKRVGITYLLEEHGSPDDLIQYLKSFEYSRQTLSRFRKKCIEVSKATEKNHFSFLRQELRSKLVCHTY